jgi:hypothetical protein
MDKKILEELNLNEMRDGTLLEDYPKHWHDQHAWIVDYNPETKKFGIYCANSYIMPSYNNLETVGFEPVQEHDTIESALASFTEIMGDFKLWCEDEEAWYKKQKENRERA